MRNKRWHLTIALLVCITVVFVYARGKLVARGIGV